MSSTPRTDLEGAFPKLGPDNYEITSQRDGAYNCIAWAMGVDDRKYWPASMAPYVWPSDVPAYATVEAFRVLFQREGFVTCSDGEPEDGWEKVAIYAKDGKPTHAARQLPNGVWASKLGDEEDIEHAGADAVSDSIYGDPVVFMRRPRGAAS